MFETFKFIDLFAGIGGIKIPFDELGGECVFSSEIDAKACDSYEANYGHRPSGDITAIDARDIPDHDILLGGFPCQAFSVAGKRLGFQDTTKGTLFFDIARILDEKKPAAFLLENVKNLKAHDGGNTYAVIEQTLQGLGYRVHTRILNALDFGLPQKRERTIIVGFRTDVPFEWPEVNLTRANLADFLEPGADQDASLLASQYIRDKRAASMLAKAVQPPFPAIWHENKAGLVSALPYSVALRREGSHNYILVNGVRLPSSRELLAFQGFPADFKIVVSAREIRKQTGNAVPVPMIRAVAQQMLKAMRA
jgi:DNA (cytosine-5)-methyltransferase 1